MSEQYARPVFRALDGHTYDTERKACCASREYLVREKMIELLGLEDEQDYRDYEKEYQRLRSLEWFLAGRERISAALCEAVEYAEQKLQEGEQ